MRSSAAASRGANSDACAEFGATRPRCPHLAVLVDRVQGEAVGAGAPDLIVGAFEQPPGPGEGFGQIANGANPWISPGLANAALVAAPAPAEVEPELARCINGNILVGHNIGVDWPLLHRRHPAIAPAALIDTLRLARHLKLGAKNSLSALAEQFGLTPQIETAVRGDHPAGLPMHGLRLAPWHQAPGPRGQPCCGQGK
jgi:hypothetical protein